MRLEAVTECEHGKIQCTKPCHHFIHVDGANCTGWCPGGSRCDAITADLVEALKQEGAEEREFEDFKYYAHKPGRYLVFSLEGEK